MSNFEVNEKIWWYLSRSSGVVAWLLLGAAVMWGLLLSTKILQTKRKPAWLLDLHRALGGMAVIFTALHLVGLVFDSYVEFGWKEILVPFASEWEPAAVAWGIVAMYILVAVQATSLAMRHLPRKLWRWVHLTSFVLFFTAAMHGASAGTDATSIWYQAGSAIVILTVMVVALYRIMTKRSVRRSETTRSLEKVA